MSNSHVYLATLADSSDSDISLPKYGKAAVASVHRIVLCQH